MFIFRERKLLKRKAETQAEEESLENKYEKLYNENAPKKKVRYLLPIKTKDGVIRRTIEEEGTALLDCQSVVNVHI